MQFDGLRNVILLKCHLLTSHDTNNMVAKTLKLSSAETEHTLLYNKKLLMSEQ